MESFLINVAHLLGRPALHPELYEVEVFHFLGAVVEVKARVAVWHNIDSLNLITECQAALDSRNEAPTLSRQTIAV